MVRRVLPCKLLLHVLTCQICANSVQTGLLGLVVIPMCRD